MKKTRNSSFSGHHKGFRITGLLQLLLYGEGWKKSLTTENVWSSETKVFIILAFITSLLSLPFLIPHKHFWSPYHLGIHMLPLLLSVCAGYFVSLEILN